MSELRSQLIRLAHSKPELRGALLPLLAKSAAGDKKLKGKPLSGVVSDSYYKHFDNIPVDMMDIGKIYDAAEKAYNGAATHAEGLEALDKAMVAAVPKYKKNASQSKRTAALTVRVDDLSLNGFQVAYLSEVAELISQGLGGEVEPMEESVSILVAVNDKGDESRISLDFRGADLIATFESYNEEFGVSTPRGKTTLPYAQITHMRLQAVADLIKRSSLIK